jgi:hypothetical protein
MIHNKNGVKTAAHNRQLAFQPARCVSHAVRGHLLLVWTPAEGKLVYAAKGLGC